MEREQELRRQQQQQMQQQQQQYQQAPQQYYEPQRSGYVATGVRLDQQMGEEEQGEFQPVWERRRAFMNAPSKPAAGRLGIVSHLTSLTVLFAWMLGVGGIAGDIEGLLQASVTRGG